ncbi:MAG TPA: FlgD immunoglobulin-like domain containing protein [Bacteroidota bacterium]|nr:FlgD immunoglobulin-like domain containing protein [Bacteroidota bacterium]
MNKKIVTLLLSLFLVLPALAQITGRINVVGVPDRYKISNKAQSTPGLSNVGIGQRVVLAPVVYGGAGGAKTADTLVAVSSAVWAITSAPTGSTATLADTSSGTPSGIMYFVPDVVGSYTVTMTATTPLGAAAMATKIINAATFVGTGISAPLTNGVATACATCHQGTLAQNFIDWTSTNHAQAVKRKLNETGGHFGTSCMSCHAIGWDGVPTSGNNGWDDLIAGIDSTFKKWFPPAHANGPGTYEGLAAEFPNLMARSGIQCENCHGPASEHAKTGNKALLATSQSSDVCAPCHYSSDRHGIGYQWQATAHAKSTYEGTQLQYTDRFPCARCHTSQGYVNETINGNVQPAAKVTGGTVYDNPMPVGCPTCHDPHKNNNPSQMTAGAYTFPQLRVSTVGDACIGCHTTRISSRGLHTSGQGPMLIGADAPSFSLAVIEAYRRNSTLMANNMGNWSGWELPGYTYENSSHSKIEERCVACHMAKSPSYIANEAANFSKGDSLMTKLGRHTFMVSTVLSNGKTYINPTGCEECHGEVTIEFVEKTQDKTKALLATLNAALPKRDSTVTASNPGGTPINPGDTITWQNSSKTPASAKRALTVAERAAAYNYQFVTNDRSYGVHNFMYAKGLLESSIEQLKLGNGAATITQIKDVPGDNGGDVQIVWNKFPAESFSIGRLTSYSVWRRDPLLPALNKFGNTVKSYEQMLATASVGDKYTLGGSVWTFVGTVPVSGQTMYSFIAPTLFDSTKTAGQKYTTFFIAGNTSDGSNTVYASPADSGYSVNNLFPTAVMGVTGTSSGAGVALSWKQSTNPQDNDVEKYVVFRSQTAGFTPDPTAPLATVKALAYTDAAVTAGSTYYYRIAALDKAGNLGAYSGEFNLKVTNVEKLNGIPTEFALDQNYPNPFNPSTEIHFALPKESHVTLTIYNISGSVVRTLVNTEMGAGYYGMTWNGTNDQGHQVASGMYFFRVQAGSFTASKKMMLMK